MKIVRIRKSASKVWSPPPGKNQMVRKYMFVNVFGPKKIIRILIIPVVNSFLHKFPKTLSLYIVQVIARMFNIYFIFFIYLKKNFKIKKKCTQYLRFTSHGLWDKKQKTNYISKLSHSKLLLCCTYFLFIIFVSVIQLSFLCSRAERHFLHLTLLILN